MGPEASGSSEGAPVGRPSGWEVVGPALVGGGCEMVRFGHVSEKPSHVEGGLSTLGFAIRVNQTPNITKQVSECGWLQLSSVEKSI